MLLAMYDKMKQYMWRYCRNLKLSYLNQNIGLLLVATVTKFMLRLIKIRSKENTIVVVAWPVRGAGNNPEALGVALHHHSPTFINVTTNLVDKRHAMQILFGEDRLEVILLIEARRIKIIIHGSVSVQRLEVMWLTCEQCYKRKLKWEKRGRGEWEAAGKRF